MLKPVNRLRSSRDFKRALSGQRLGSNDCFAVYGLPLAQQKGLSALGNSTGDVVQAAMEEVSSTPRIGFVVSKKVHKRAVRRNRIRRQLREIFRLWLLSNRHQATLSRYRVIVVIARSGALEQRYQDLEKRMDICFSRVRGGRS